MSDSVFVQYVGPMTSTNQAYRRAKFGGMFMSKEGKAFKAGLSDATRRAMAGRFPIAGPVSVELRYHFKTRANDCDSCLKLTLDAIQGHAIVNDRQIVHLDISKFKADDPKNVGLEMTIRPVPNEDTP